MALLIALPQPAMGFLTQSVLYIIQLSAVACLQVATRAWTAVADLVHAAGPALSVAQLGLPALRRVPPAEPADEARAQLSDGLRFAFSGTTSGSIAVWDLSQAQTTADDELAQVSMQFAIMLRPAATSLMREIAQPSTCN